MYGMYTFSVIKMTKILFILYLQTKLQLAPAFDRRVYSFKMSIRSISQHLRHYIFAHSLQIATVYRQLLSADIDYR